MCISESNGRVSNMKLNPELLSNLKYSILGQERRQWAISSLSADTFGSLVPSLPSSPHSPSLLCLPSLTVLSLAPILHSLVNTKCLDQMFFSYLWYYCKVHKISFMRTNKIVLTHCLEDCSFVLCVQLPYLLQQKQGPNRILSLLQAWVFSNCKKKIQAHINYAEMYPIRSLISLGQKYALASIGVNTVTADHIHR